MSSVSAVLVPLQAGQVRQQQPQQERRQHASQAQPCTGQQQTDTTSPDGEIAAAASLQEGRAAAEELQQLKSCVVCLDAPRSVLLLPCKHLALCEACTQQLQQHGTGSGDTQGAAGGGAGSAAVSCPVCRVPATQHIPGVFFA
jgi:hypothetical protein